MDMARALADPAGMELWRMGSDELVSFAVALSGRVSALQGLQLRTVAEIDRRGVAIEQGASSSARWLTDAARVAPAAASRMVRLGLALSRLPDVAAALGTGAITVDHAEVIVRVLQQLPDDLPDDGVDACRTYLLEAALAEDPQALNRRGRELLARISPDDAELTEEHAVARRELRINDCGDGLHKVTGWLDTEAAELAKAVLSPLAKPRPEDNGERDARSPAKRLGDAFVDLLGRAADHACVPGEGYARPHLTLHVRANALATGHGPAAELTFLGPLSIASARRLACDAEITPMTLDEHGVPLDVGRTTYTVSGGLRRALIARDRGCAFPGCGRPPGWCHAHHIIHWADNGDTALDNLVLLCGHHHRVVHHQGWSVATGDDRQPWFTPPAWIDPAQQPRPAHRRRPAPPAPELAHLEVASCGSSAA
ncbi:HNH endonuclease signature motif containing protein [Rhodococcus sp. X156]|uniref:HNH endonuclease signature motif containing protein n=1 Tax=Rhodococcus sp. X156 TaxID=2499145 RepID=UPI000FD6CEFC|nr:HNH endonuclease signature motif containing protein [Rhodococcus sp. X156]